MARVKITCTEDQKKIMLIRLCASCPPYPWAERKCDEYEDCKECWEKCVNWEVKKDD